MADSEQGSRMNWMSDQPKAASIVGRVLADTDWATL